MADSSSLQDQTASSPLLTIRPNQKLIIQLTPFVYDPYMLYVVECLKYSLLVIALTQVELVPMSLLSQVALDVADKLAKRGKKQEPKKDETEGPSSPKNRKVDKAAPLATKKKKVKKMVKRPKVSLPAVSDDEAQSADKEERVHLEGSPRGNTPPRSPTAEVWTNIPSPPPSPKQTTVPITVAPIPPTPTTQPNTTVPPPPPVSTIPISTTPLPPPIFSQATYTTTPINTTTTSTEHLVKVNVSDTRANTENEPCYTQTSFTLTLK
ncbi:extensin-like [Lactuca sativa]|uniref:extensin-like n=1 Tax=Lactuca sativa TaxID=4236 RepID=UPI0022AF27FF|nr:extensin-like [Lactuca sativa]